VKIRIARVDDLEEAKALHNLAFAGNTWSGDDHEFWFAYDEAGKVVGFAAAKWVPETKAVYLSRAAVVRSARRLGLHKRLIRVRLQWAKSLGVDLCITYTSMRNYRSMLNLVACGFRFEYTRSPKPWHLLSRYTGPNKRHPVARVKASWKHI
jgi:GNAT superfamily N-acetyltransferase